MSIPRSPIGRHQGGDCTVIEVVFGLVLLSPYPMGPGLITVLPTSTARSSTPPSCAAQSATDERRRRERFLLPGTDLPSVP